MKKCPVCLLVSATYSYIGDPTAEVFPTVYCMSDPMLPFFPTIVENVTVSHGRKAVLKCEVENLRNYKVRSWGITSSASWGENQEIVGEAWELLV